MVKSSWLYSLRKEELTDICGALALDTKDTVEDMRKAVTTLIATPDSATDMKVKLMELKTMYATKTLHLPEGTGQVVSDTRKSQFRLERPWIKFANGPYATMAESGEERYQHSKNILDLHAQNTGGEGDLRRAWLDSNSTACNMRKLVIVLACAKEPTTNVLNTCRKSTCLIHHYYNFRAAGHALVAAHAIHDQPFHTLRP
uniref:Uncharacterized protein n=1 Tax=Glossina pallidipes TaxID=7398 RepID=A0A1A9ZBF8_GLOPL